MKQAGTVLLIVALGVSGCGEAPGEAAVSHVTSGESGECPLLTRSEAQTVLGSPVAVPEISGSFGTTQCQFVTTDGEAPRMLTVISQGAGAASALPVTRDAARPMNGLPGVAAYSGASSLFVFVEDRVLTVMIGEPGTPAEQRQAHLLSAAQAASARL